MAAPATDATEKVKEALTFWEAFDLDGRRQKMDNTCLELRDGKEVTLPTTNPPRWIL